MVKLKLEVYIDDVYAGKIKRYRDLPHSGHVWVLNLENSFRDYVGIESQEKALGNHYKGLDQRGVFRNPSLNILVESLVHECNKWMQEKADDK